MFLLLKNMFSWRVQRSAVLLALTLSLISVFSVWLLFRGLLQSRLAIKEYLLNVFTLKNLKYKLSAPRLSAGAGLQPSR